MGVIPDPRLASWANMCLLDGRSWSGTPQDATPPRATSSSRSKDQGDGRRLPWGPLADGHLNRRWPPSPVPRHMACELHVLDKWGFALVVVADEEPRAPRPATGWCHLRDSGPCLSIIGFDPADSAEYAAEAALILGGPPIGPDRY